MTERTYTASEVAAICRAVRTLGYHVGAKVGSMQDPITSQELERTTRSIPLDVYELSQGRPIWNGTDDIAFLRQGINRTSVSEN